jgi:hypothetical protein
MPDITGMSITNYTWDVQEGSVSSGTSTVASVTVEMESHDLLWEMVTEFRGTPPEIAVNPSVLASIQDDDEKPFFVTLRIGKANAESRNKTLKGKPRRYGQKAMESIMEQVQRGVGGNLGHIPALHRDSQFNLPVLRWVGSQMDAEGIVWGKAYVPKYADDVRTYLKDSMKLNAAVGTSIYGMSEVNQETGEVLRVNLETIDLADAGRVGILDAVGVPRVTAEMIQTDDLVQEIPLMAEQITEQAVEVTQLSEQVTTLTSEVATLQTQLAEMQTTLETVTSERDSARTTITEMESTILENTITACVSEMVVLEPLRPAVSKHLALLRRVGDVTNEETARGAITAYLSDVDTQAIAQKLVNEMSGGNAIVGAGRVEEGKLKDTPEERRKAAAEFGIN